jgi:hypothetical protein
MLVQNFEGGARFSPPRRCQQSPDAFLTKRTAGFIYHPEPLLRSQVICYRSVKNVFASTFAYRASVVEQPTSRS